MTRWGWCTASILPDLVLRYGAGRRTTWSWYIPPVPSTGLHTTSVVNRIAATVSPSHWYMGLFAHQQPRVLCHDLPRQRPTRALFIHLRPQRRRPAPPAVVRHPHFPPRLPLRALPPRGLPLGPRTEPRYTHQSVPRDVSTRSAVYRGSTCWTCRGRIRGCAFVRTITCWRGICKRGSRGVRGGAQAQLWRLVRVETDACADVAVRGHLAVVEVGCDRVSRMRSG